MEPGTIYIPQRLHSVKTWMIAAFILGTIFANPAIAQKTTLPMTSLRGYTVRDTAFSRKDFNVWLVTTTLTFDSLFVSIDSTLKKPNFDEELVLAIKAETPNYSYKTTFKDMFVQRRILKVRFKVEKEKFGRADYGWVSIVTFPKDKSIRRVNFYYDDMMIRSIPVVTVY